MAKTDRKKIILSHHNVSIHYSVAFFLIFLLAFVLRIWRFNQIPPSLFGDEVDTGYQAYSILKTGRDYFGNLLPVHFQSFGDWRMPLYIYLTVPFVAIFGLTGFVVRFPSLLFSLASLPLVYFLIKEITKEEKIALLTAFFLAISPWHFHFSRLALEVTLFGFLFLLGLWFFLKSIKSEKNKWLVFSAVSFAFSLYAYSTAKLFIPLILFFLFWFFKKKILNKKALFYFIIPLFLISLPIMKDVLFGQGGARFSTIAIWSDPAVAKKVEMARRYCSYSGNLKRVFHNKVLVYFNDFLNNYLQSFSTEYLFIRGDPNLRHNPIEKGQVYPIYFPLILLGALGALGEFFKTKNKKLLLPFLILFLAPIPAALTQNGGTHAIRTYQSLPWWQFLASFGLVFILSKIKSVWQKRTLILVFVLLLFFSVFSFFHFYFSHFPNKPGAWWRWWNYGYREVFEFLSPVEQDYNQIYLSPAHEPPIVYALFYSRYPPEKIQREIDISSIGFGKLLFANPDLSFLKTGEKKEEILFIVTPGYSEAMGYELNDYQTAEMLKEIKYPNGEIAFYIFKTR